MDSAPSRDSGPWIIGGVVVALFVIAAGVIALVLDQGEDPPPFGTLTAEQQVYDDTGTSISIEAEVQIDDRINEIEQGNDVEIVAYVRALDASADDTLDQVAVLQEQWSAAASTDQQRTVAILINRHPEDPEDARAGIYAGEDLVDGALPEDDQADIVEQSLIPSLAEGEVAGSLVTGLDQIDITLQQDTTPNAFEHWSTAAGRTWAPWVTLALTLVGFLVSLRIFSRRVKVVVPQQRPTSARPDDLAAAVGGALALGGPSASALPATIVDLAGRGVLSIEPEAAESDADLILMGEESEPKIEAVQIRLIDPGAVRGPVEKVVWRELESRADDGVLRGKALSEASQQTSPVQDAVRQQLTERGWLNPAASRARNALGWVMILATLLATAAFVLLAVGEELLMLVGVIPAVLLAITATVMIFSFSKLSSAGQHAAASWQAYREGLAAAANDPHATLDLDVAVPDLIATGQADEVEQLLERAGERGQALAAFAGLGQGQEALMVPFWAIYAGAFMATSAGTGSTVTGTVGGGGGGAAGST